MKHSFLFLLLFLSGCGAVVTGLAVGIGLQSSSSNTTNNLPNISLTAPVANSEKNDLITFSYKISDPESNPVNITVEWSTNGTNWKNATELPGKTIDTESDGRLNLSSSPSGKEHSFVWNSFEDIKAVNLRGVTVRLVPVDVASGQTGNPTSIKFDVVNLYTTSILGRTQLESNEQPYLPLFLLAIPSEQKCYITNKKTSNIVSLDLVTGKISPLAGTGLTPYNGDDILATLANLSQPGRMSIGVSRSTGSMGILFADTYNHRLRFLDLNTRFISTVAGTGLQGYDESFSFFNSPLDKKLSIPYGVNIVMSLNSSSVDGYCFSEAGNRIIRYINLSSENVTFCTGILDFGTNTDITIKPNEMRTIAGNNSIHASSDGSIWVKSNPLFTTAASFRKPGALQFIRLQDASFSPAVYVVDDNTLRVVNLGTSNLIFFPSASSPVTVPAGSVGTLLNNPNFATTKFLNDGMYAPEALCNSVQDVVVTPSSQDVYNTTSNFLFSESAKHSIWYVNGRNGQLTRIAGNEKYGFSGDGGNANNASMAIPMGMTFTTNTLLVADHFNNRIRAINFSSGSQVIAGKTIPSFGIETIASGPSQAVGELSRPVKIIPDSSSSDVYIADEGANRIVKINSSNRVAEIVAGTGKGASTGDGGLAVEADIGKPKGITLWVKGGTKLLLLGDNGSSQVSGTGGLKTLGKIRVVNLGSTTASLGNISSLESGKIQTLVGGGSTAVQADSGNPGISNDLYDVDPLQLKLGEVLDVAVDQPENGNLPAIYILEKEVTPGASSIYRLLVYNPNVGYDFQFTVNGLVGNTRTVSSGKVSALAIYNSQAVADFTQPLKLSHFDTPGRFAFTGSARNSAANTNFVAVIPLIQNSIVLGLNYTNAIKEIVTINIPSGQGALLAGKIGNSGFNGDWQLATEASLNRPEGLIYIPASPPTDPSDVLAIADTQNHRIRLVFGRNAGNTTIEGKILTYMGSGQPGYNGETLPPGNTHLNGPTHIIGFQVTNLNGKKVDIILVADANNNRIRQFCAEGE